MPVSEVSSFRKASYPNNSMKFCLCVCTTKNGFVLLPPALLNQSFALSLHSMEVIGFDPALPKTTAADLGIQLMDLADVWGKADFVTLHTPLTPDTKDLVNDETIDQVFFQSSTCA